MENTQHNSPLHLHLDFPGFTLESHKTHRTVCRLPGPRVFLVGLECHCARVNTFTDYSVWTGCGIKNGETTSRIFIHLLIMTLWSKYLQHIGNQRVSLYKASLQSIQMCKNDSSVSQTTDSAD